MTEVHPVGVPKRRLKSCVQAWPECSEGEYDPSCCRFPKSCSCTVYRDGVTDDDLEPVLAPHPVPETEPEGLTFLESAAVLGRARRTGPEEKP